MLTLIVFFLDMYFIGLLYYRQKTYFDYYARAGQLPVAVFYCFSIKFFILLSPTITIHI